METSAKRQRILRSTENRSDADLLEDIRSQKTNSIVDFVDLLHRRPLGTLDGWEAGLSETVCKEALEVVLQQALTNPLDSKVVEDAVILAIALMPNPLADSSCAALGLQVERLLIRIVDEQSRTESATCTPHEERCLHLVSRIFVKQPEWGDWEHRLIAGMQTLSMHLDVWRWCSRWNRYLISVPVEHAQRTKLDHKHILEALCNYDHIEYILGKDIIQYLLTFSEDQAWRCYNDVAWTLVRRCALEIATLDGKIRAVRAGIIQLAWSMLPYLLDESDEWDSDNEDEDACHNAHIKCHMILRWCYPQSPGCESDQLRRIFLQDTRGPAWCCSMKRLLQCLSCRSEDFIWNSMMAFERVLDVPVHAMDINRFLFDIYNKMYLANVGQKNTKVPSCLSDLTEVLNKVLITRLETVQTRRDLFDYEHSGGDKLENAFVKALQPAQPLRFLLAHTHFLDFSTKSVYIKLLLRWIRESKDGHDTVFLHVPRAHVTNGVCHALKLDLPSMSESSPAGNIEIKFSGEMGADQGGVRRAWFDAAGTHFIQSDFFEALDEDAAHLSSYGVFPNYRRLGTRQWTPRAVPVLSTLQADWHEHFRLLGAIFGFALLNGETISIRFTPQFWRVVFQHKVVLSEDLDELLDQLSIVDVTLAHKLRAIQHGEYKNIWGVDTLGAALQAAGLRTTFAVPISRDPVLTGDWELKKGGSQYDVTEESKDEYLRLLIQYHLDVGIREQAGHFRHGFLRIVCPDVIGDTLDACYLRLDEQLKDLHHSSSQRLQGELLFVLSRAFCTDELSKLFCGVDFKAQDVQAWKRNTKYEGYTKDDQVIKWFWEVVEGFTLEEASQLLRFTWGSCNIPHHGFTLQFIIRSVQACAETLPVAHTCEFSLDLPPYESKLQLEEKLRQGMLEETFQMS